MAKKLVAHDYSGRPVMSRNNENMGKVCTIMTSVWCVMMEQTAHKIVMS
jgi:hypothetical protein